MKSDSLDLTDFTVEQAATRLLQNLETDQRVRTAPSITK